MLNVRSLRTVDRRRASQRGVTLIVVLIILVIVTIVGIAGARIALLGERSTRYDRDYQIAWEAAEAALIDAEFDIAGPNTSGNSRVSTFGLDESTKGVFVDNCGTTVAARGLCNPSATTVPVWQATGFDFVTETSSSPFVVYGDKTGRVYQSGSGIQGAHAPHYIIEWVIDQRPGGPATYPKRIMYRITAIGFGPNEQTQVVMQSSYAKEKP